MLKYIYNVCKIRRWQCHPTLLGTCPTVCEPGARTSPHGTVVPASQGAGTGAVSLKDGLPLG